MEKTTGEFFLVKRYNTFSAYKILLFAGIWLHFALRPVLSPVTRYYGSETNAGISGPHPGESCKKHYD